MSNPPPATGETASERLERFGVGRHPNRPAAVQCEACQYWDGDHANGCTRIKRDALEVLALLAQAEATIRTLIREIEKLQYEQAISEGRLRVLLEKADALRTAEIRCDNLEAERDAARAELDELQNEFVGQNRRLGTAEAALASARAETSALYGLLEQALNGWGAHARKNIEHSDIRRLRALAHRGERP